MGRLVNRFLDFVGIEEAGEDNQGGYQPRNARPEREYQDYQRDPYDRRRDQGRGYESQGREESRGRYDYDEADHRGGRKGSKVVNHPSAMGGQNQHQMMIYQMEDYDDARTVIDDLINERSVLINLEMVDVDVSQRIVDMLSGATYALGASLKKAAANTYLLAPESVDVSGSYEEEARRGRGGSFFGGGRR